MTIAAHRFLRQPSAWTIGVLTLFLIIPDGTVIAQTSPPSSEPVDTWITLNFPENVDLKTLIDYASQRLGLNIIYQEDQLANQKVTIKSPAQIPSSALPALLQDLLKMKGFALVDTGEPGWKRVVSLQASSTPATQPAAENAEHVVTQAFALRFIDAQRADQAIKPFLSGPTAGSLGISEQHVLLVTDFASNINRASQIIDLIDQPNRNIRVQFLPVRNADPLQLSQELKQILTARSRAQSLPGQNPENAVDVSPDRRTGQLIVVGPSAVVEEAADLVKGLDVLVSEQQSPIRFYKLANATAADVLETISALEGEPPAAGDTSQRPSARPTATSLQPSMQPIQQPGIAAGASNVPGAISGGGTVNPYGDGRQTQSAVPPAAPQANAPPTAADNTSSAPHAGLHTRNATVAADPNTNSIIVIAEPSVQKLYEQIIRTLDKRRPQVLIEATIVTLDTSHGLTFGIEVGTRSKPGSSQYVAFTNYGFSTPDPTTGRLAITPGVGFNGTVIASDLAEVIIRALSQSTRAKVTSAPRILVNDNATGSLSSLTEAPFTTTAIGTTIATTAFGGYAQAGTTVTLTPHISESDYLQLEYQVSLSSFTGQGDPAHGIPPGIQQDSVQSKVTIPDGSTVVVGGLNRTNFTRAVSSVPVLDQIPVLRQLIGRHDNNDEQITLFVFLRPIILRDDEFEDLKFLSERDVKEAGLPGGAPVSKPLPIH